MYYGWSKEFLEAGKKRLAGETARANGRQVLVLHHLLGRARPTADASLKGAVERGVAAT